MVTALPPLREESWLTLSGRALQIVLDAAQLGWFLRRHRHGQDRCAPRGTAVPWPVLSAALPRFSSSTRRATVRYRAWPAGQVPAVTMQAKRLPSPNAT